MPIYIFQAKATDGKFVKGEVEALNEAEARVKIRAQKMIPIKITARAGLNKELKKFALFKDSVSRKDLQIFTRQLAVLIGAGVPVVQSLEAMIQGARSPALGRVLEKVVEDVEKGKPLAQAMGVHGHVFDRMYVNLITAGEEGGMLDGVLNRLAEYIEKSVKMKGKIVGALWYPGAIVVVATGVIVGILVFVIPQFVQMFEGMGQELPTLTQWVINASKGVQKYWYLVIAVGVGIPLSLKTYYATENGRKILDAFILDVPIFGDLILKGSIARFTRTLSTLLQAGVRIMDSLEIAANTAGNWIIENAIQKAKTSVSKGKTLAEPLKQEKYMPNMVVQMISVGEQTGNLDTMLGKIADFYEDEVDQAANTLTSMIEPLLMVFLGGIIAVLVVAMYLPIFNMANVVGDK
ncbi:MAG: type II secretion system F family protein [Bdellovibrionales bacterium]|nr:type II secretion system F family protein [Bdellovibrionales bacterium]